MKSNTPKLNLPAIAFAAAALASALPSAAIARDETRTERVTYSDLNLANEAGVKALDRRLDRAVQRVCGDDRRNILTPPAVTRCMRSAHASVIPQRAYAIARATGSQDGTKAWAENAANGQLAVTIAE